MIGKWWARRRRLRQLADRQLIRWVTWLGEYRTHQGRHREVKS